MTTTLPQKFQAVAKALVPYVPDTSHQMALISVEPPLPCFICAQPAQAALIAPAPGHFSGAAAAWLTFPICADCEQRQVGGQTGPAT